MRRIALLAACLACFAVVTATTAAPPPKYHLELEITPGAAFPYLGHFGNLDVHVYPGGVRGEALWLHAISRNGSPTLTVANVIGRTRMDVKTSELSATLRKLAGSAAGREREASPLLAKPVSGKVRGIAATRHRLVYGTDAWIDVWTTEVISPNPQFRALVNEALEGIAPGTAAVARRLPGTPVYVELNFRRFKKLPLVRMTSLAMSSKGEEDALTIGRFYISTNMFDKLLSR